MMCPRRRFPRRLTIRWFATRGWAFGGCLAFLVAAVWLRPPGLDTPSWLLTTAFAGSAVSLGLLGWWPENRAFRLMVVAATVSTALLRSWALIVADQPPDLGSRAAASVIWMFIAYCCWLLATLTAQIPNRHKV